MANNKCTIGLSWWDSRILGFREFGFRDLSSLTLDTALTISSLVNDSRPNNIFGAFRLFAINMNFFRATCVRLGLILICAPVILVRWLISQCCVVKDVVHLCTIHNPHDFLSFEGFDSFYEVSCTVFWTVTNSIFIRESIASCLLTSFPSLWHATMTVNRG